MLRPLGEFFKPGDFPNLLVGLEAPDDAAVWKLDDERALVLTTDFFTPVVDDPYDYGAIAAANALSDVYAMGGQPLLALNVAALPPDLPEELLTEIIRGGAEKAREAGVVIAGGHTIQDKEPKFGMVVAGMVNPGHLLSKGGAQAGDLLLLTKPLGFGVTTTALKREKAAAQDVAEAVGWMKRLNGAASQAAVRAGLCAATDITGYSLLGHAHEMAKASGVGLKLHFDQVPFIRCANHYANMGTFPGGAADNRMHFGQFVRFASHISEIQEMLLFDPQTSGGLLLAVPADKLQNLMDDLAARQQPAWVIGEAVPGDGIQVD